jgi:sterol 3beta-glucosyltransferase
MNNISGKAVLFSIGTRGDMEPLLAIAEILKSNGWEVICVFPEQFRNTVEQMNIPFRGFDKVFLEMLEGRDAKQFLGGKISFFKRIGIFLRMARTGIKLAKGMVALQHQTLMEEKPDLVIYHPKCNLCLIWGMAHPGKSIMVSPIPGMAHPINHLTVLGGNYGRVLNRLSFWFVNTIKSMVLARTARTYRSDYPGIVISASTIKAAMLQQERSFYMISPALFPRPSYWPVAAQVVGYYERNKAVHWQPDEALLNFLSTHEKPILITFGSMTNPDPVGRSRIIVDVLKQNNIAAIINTSWGGLQRIKDCPGHIYFTDNIPYDWLFPKLYAVVHHGGSGTTHMSLKYGCPCLLIPHALDQFYWASVVSDMHLGPKGLTIRKFKEQDFEKRLLDLLHTALYKKNALAMRERMLAESNLENLYARITK